MWLETTRASSAARNGIIYTILASALSGCVSTTIPSLRQPERLYSLDEEAAALRQTALLNAYYSTQTVQSRNEYITARMYATDLYYTKYESQLTHENQEANFLATMAALGLSTAGAITTSASGTRILSALAGGVIGADNAYNEKILLSKAIQNVQTQMRANRAEQAALLLANMKCSIQDYPMGMALSDLEAYYRAGTFTAGLVRLSDTVAKAEDEAKAKKDVQTAASPTTAATQLQNDARTKAAAADNSTRCRPVS
jgi:hypothetical protein